MSKFFMKQQPSGQNDARKVVWQFFKFGLVGLSNTVVSMLVYYLVLWLDDDLYMFGSVLGTIVSIANAFVWNDLFVFSGNSRDFKSVMKRLGRTYISYGGTSFLANVLLWLEVTFFHVSKGAAPILNMAVTIPLNFVINKFWTFRKDR